VIHDQRGNAIWDWAIEPNTSTTGLLRALDAPGQLSLEAPEPNTAFSGDPYNRTTR
jgi:hypothetical protein